MTDQDAKTLFLQAAIPTRLFLDDITKRMQAVAERFIFEPVTQEQTALIKEAFTDCLQRATQQLSREEFERSILVEVTKGEFEFGLCCNVRLDPRAPDWLKSRFRILMND
jgi:hypothetical protein